MPVDDLRAAEILLENARYEYDNAEKWFAGLEEKASGHMNNVSLALAFTLGAIAYFGREAPWVGALFAPALVCLLMTAVSAIAARRLLPSAAPPSTSALRDHIMHPDADEAGALLLLAQGTSAAASAKLEACERKADNIGRAEQWIAVGLLLLTAALVAAVAVSLALHQ